jgi:hypothetical protein
MRENMATTGTSVLQNCMDLEKDVPVSSSEACPVSSYDANNFVSVKVEEVPGVGEEEDPLLLTSPQRKANEREVSCYSVCILLGFISICMSFQSWICGL